MSTATEYSYEDADEQHLSTNLNEDSPRISQPINFKMPLKQHQLALIYKCDQLERTSQTPFIVTDSSDSRFKYEISQE